MNKEQIISEFNNKRKKLDDEYPNLDGTKYIRSIPLDAYGGKIDMPKDKFPEWHQHRQEEHNIFNEYNMLIYQLAKYKKGDIVVVGCEDAIEFGEIYNADLETINKSMHRLIGNYSEYDKDITYMIKFEKSFNVWKYGSSGGSFGTDSCICSFEENNVLMKVSTKEMEEMIKIPIKGLKIMYPQLFPFRQYNQENNKIKNLVCGFVDKITK